MSGKKNNPKNAETPAQETPTQDAPEQEESAVEKVSPETKAQLAEAINTVKVLKEKVDDQNETIDALEEKIVSLNAAKDALYVKNKNLSDKNEMLVKANDDLRKQMRESELVKENSEGLVEVVVVPVVKGTRFGPKIKNGEKWPSYIDKYGFERYMLRKSHACSVISDKNATPHYLVGPMDSLTCEVIKGNYSTFVEIKRHSVMMVKSEPVWVPVEIEESRD